MKKLIVLLSVVFAFGLLCSCNRIDAGHEGILVNLYGNQKGEGISMVTGWVWYNPLTKKVYEYPTYVQTIDYEAFTVNAKDGLAFDVDPTVSMNIYPGSTPEVFKKYRLKLDQVMTKTLYIYIKDAFRIELNKYTAEEIISNREQFELAIEARLRETLDAEHFHLNQLTTGLKYPQALLSSIEAKTKAVQEEQRIQNEVLVAKAQAEKLIVQAEAERKANELRTKALTPAVLEQMWIEKWDGHLPTYGAVPTMFADITKR